jgi:capsular exopolysaccharide synthesis family protein
LPNQRSLSSEKFRRLKTLLMNQTEVNAQVIVVTSPGAREGKSAISINLALTFAANENEKTLLVDADLRRPSQADKLQPPPKLGMSEILDGRAELDHAVISLEDSPLEVLPAGGSVSDPVELISSEAAKSLFAELRRRYQRIIVDTPPIIPFTDADAIGALADGVLLVVRAGATPVSGYQQAVSAVTSAKVLGAVLNEAAFSVADWNSYEKYDYEIYYGKDPEE